VNGGEEGFSPPAEILQRHCWGKFQTGANRGKTGLKKNFAATRPEAPFIGWD
jgi:hypothetical protein